MSILVGEDWVDGSREYLMNWPADFGMSWETIRQSRLMSSDHSFQVFQTPLGVMMKHQRWLQNN